VHFGLTSTTPVTVEVTFMTKAGRKSQTLKDISPAEFNGKSLAVRQAPTR
jgi:hypothetical protein